MANFKEAYKITMAHEGAYANNPADNGGETYAGVARKFWPKWGGWAIIDLLKTKVGFPKSLSNSLPLQAHVEDFYKRNFWDANKLDDILNQPLANELFDTAVNMGAKTGATMLQEALNLLNRRGKDYPDVVVDGVIGNQTIKAVNTHPNKAKLLKVLNLLQGAKYIAIVKNNPSQEVFFNGWMERVTI